MSHLPQIIILNGCHGAGKTALAKALQEKLPQHYLYFSFASILSGWPTRDLLAQGEAIVRPDDDIGLLLRAYHYAIPGFLQAGCSLILDHAWCERAEKRELLTELAGYRILLLGVHCPLPELQRREQARADGASGMAAWELARVHQDMRYDLEISTMGMSPEDNANLIYSHIQGGCILNGAIDTLDDLNMLA